MSDHSRTLPLPLSDLFQSIRAPGESVKKGQPLVQALSLLFEASPILENHLVPDLSQRIKDASPEDQPECYAQLIDRALDIVHEWSWDRQAEFVGGHPRIGEVKGLSVLSAVEQGQAGPNSGSNAPHVTPPEVLERLAYLNTVYERCYPGLVYITFVNGRTRAQIRDEMEDKLTAEGVLPAADEGGIEKIIRHDFSSENWVREVKRAVNDVGRIAKSRLTNLAIE